MTHPFNEWKVLPHGQLTEIEPRLTDPAASSAS